MKNFKELSATYETLVKSFSETNKESKTFVYVYGVIAKYWNGKKGVPVGYRDLFMPLGFENPTAIKRFIETAVKGTNPNVPKCFYNDKGALCRCVSAVVYVKDKDGKRIAQKDKDGNIIRANKMTAVKTYSIKTLLDLFMQIDNETKGAK